jgi:hypothetical protein
MKRFAYILLIIMQGWLIRCGSTLPSSSSGVPSSSSSGAPGSSSSGVPGFVQSTSEANTQAYESGYVTEPYFGMPNPQQSGDCVFVPAQIGTSSTLSFLSATDDANNTYSLLENVADTTNGKRFLLFEAPVTAAGHKVTISWSSPGTGYVSEAGLEFYNVGPCGSPDQSWTLDQDTTSTTINAGSSALTTSTLGDMILMCADILNPTAGSPVTFTAGSQPGISWAFVPDSVQIWNGTACEWGVYSLTAAINPQMGISSSKEYIAIAVAIKPAASGSALSGKEVAGIEHLDVSGWTGNNTSSFTEQIPVAGNAAVVSGSSYCDYYITAISGSSTTWTQAVEEPATDCTDGGNAYIWFACNLTPGSVLSLTFTMESVSQSGEEPDTALYYYDIQNATTGSSTACVDSANATTGDGWAAAGNQTTGTTLTAPSSMSPSVSGDVFIGVQSIEIGYGVTAGSPGIFDAGGWFNTSGVNQCGGTGAGYAPPNIPDECNFAGHYVNSGTSPVSFVGTMGGEPGYYAAAGVAIK